MFIDIWYALFYSKFQAKSKFSEIDLSPAKIKRFFLISVAVYTLFGSAEC